MTISTLCRGYCKNSPSYCQEAKNRGRSVYRDKVGEDCQSVENYYRLYVFLPLVDSVYIHLQDRFRPVQQKLFGLIALIPAHLGNYHDVIAGAALYESLVSLRDLPAEFELVG